MVATSGEILRGQLADTFSPAFDEARWLMEYVDMGAPHGPPIVLSIGETWEGPPPELLAGLAEAPAHTHGYLLGAYGLPRLRAQLERYLWHGYELAGRVESAGLRTAVSWSGTRGAMFDFGRLLLAERTSACTPVMLTCAPGWDYAGVFEPLGYQTEYLALHPEDGFRPRVDRLRELAERLARDPWRSLALVVVNAQHNPTGVDWGDGFVAELIEVAAQAGAAVLIDDAHHALHDPGHTPTAAIRVLCQMLRQAGDAPVPWLLTRSLGKEFSCNGWALGALIGEVALIDQLCADIAQHRQYSIAGPQQWAMARWLETGPVEDYLRERRERLAASRAAATAALVTELGVPRASVHSGRCSPFALVELPPAYQKDPAGNRRFRQACFERTGVILSDAWPLGRAADHAGGLPYVRMFLDLPSERVIEAIGRMRAAGIHHDMNDMHDTADEGGAGA